ncbi:GGDEF domain-containing protein [Vibrio methylphosphonaticus]|uniref:GGDEF domain-containing protein n=1 Tax=Vibrio methylphosphonaticus TaxID=2946866 RepID=UPI002029DCEB|nr:diguanylate cyclase [Vibrio methylphosphonaticus]MCL9774844.1 diguanylate cyclase [Vibrio methylphosphonaticus]
MKLSSKITLIFFVSIFGTFSCVAWLTYQHSVTLLVSNTEEKMKQTSGTVIRSLQEKLHDIERMNDTLATLLENTLQDDTQQDNTNSAALSSIIAAVIQNDVIFNSISVIDRAQSHQEILRLERNQQQNVIQVDSDELNNLAHISFYTQAFAFHPHEIFVSPISMHYDRISHPKPVPFVFVIYPLPTLNKRDLSLLIAIDIEQLMENATSIMDAPSTFFITNTDGDYLLHSDNDKQFGYTRGKIEQIQQDHPVAFNTISENIVSFFKVTDQQLPEGHSYVYFSPAKFLIHGTSHFYMFGQTRRDSITELWTHTAIRGFGVTVLIFMLTALLLSYSLFKLITLPLTRISRLAQRIALGKTAHFYQFNQTDEIGDLAKALNYLQHHLNTKFHELKVSEQKFQELARRDDLTRLPNRKDFHSRLENEIAHHQVNQLHFGLLFLDVNNFKAVNDNEGHHVGDNLLQGISNLLTNNLRSSDLVCRYGGDEFVILLSNLRQLNVIHIICDKLHYAMEDLVGSLQLDRYGLSLSIGVSIYPESAKTPNELIKLADQAMYNAKHNGSSQTHWHSPFQ